MVMIVRNKALQLTDNPLRGLSAAELGRWRQRGPCGGGSRRPMRLTAFGYDFNRWMEPITSSNAAKRTQWRTWTLTAIAS